MSYLLILFPLLFRMEDFKWMNCHCLQSVVCHKHNKRVCLVFLHWKYVREIFLWFKKKEFYWFVDKKEEKTNKLKMELNVAKTNEWYIRYNVWTLENTKWKRRKICGKCMSIKLKWKLLLERRKVAQLLRQKKYNNKEGWVLSTLWSAADSATPTLSSTGRSRGKSGLSGKVEASSRSPSLSLSLSLAAL